MGKPHRIVAGRPFMPGRRRIALLAGRFPSPRLFHLLRQAACEFDVVLFALSIGPAPECEPWLEFCSRIALAEAPETMQELWDRLSRELNVEARQVEGTEMAAYGGDLLTVPAVEPPPRTWRDWRRRALLRRFLRVAVVPDGLDLDSLPPSPEPEGLGVSVAVADPWFIERVWPRVARQFPQAALASAHEEANVVVGPAVEAMALERAIVATRGAPESLGLRHNVSAWIVPDADGLAEGIVKLLGDPELRRRLAQAARRVAEERFDWKRIGVLERSLLREIVERPPLIRPARKDDVPELDRIQRLSPEAVLWEASGYLAYDCRVAELRGKVAGFVVCRRLSSDEAEVLSLVVDPDMRNRGIASRLMREMLDHRAGTTWYLEVRESNRRARNLYRKLGFEDVSLRPAYYQDTGEAAVVMRLKPC